MEQLDESYKSVQMQNASSRHDVLSNPGPSNEVERVMQRILTMRPWWSVSTASEPDTSMIDAPARGIVDSDNLHETPSYLRKKGAHLHRHQDIIMPADIWSATHK